MRLSDERFLQALREAVDEYKKEYKDDQKSKGLVSKKIYVCPQCGDSRIGAGRCNNCEFWTKPDGAWNEPDYRDEDYNSKDPERRY